MEIKECVDSVNSALKRAETAHVTAMALGDDDLITYTEGIVLELLVKKNIVEKFGDRINPKKLCSDMDEIFMRLVKAEEAKKMLAEAIETMFDSVREERAPAS